MDDERTESGHGRHAAAAESYQWTNTRDYAPPGDAAAGRDTQVYTIHTLLELTRALRSAMDGDEEYTAVLFTNGGSQAVRLPKQLRRPGTTVRVRRTESGVLLEPIEVPGSPPGFRERMAAPGPLNNEVEVLEPLRPSPHRDSVVGRWVASLDARAGDELGD